MLRAAGRVQQGLGDAVAALCCHPSEDHTLFAAAGSAVLQLDLRRGLDSAAVLRSVAVNQDEVNSIAVSAANGGWLAAGDDSGEVQVISLQQQAAASAAAAGGAAAEAGAAAAAEAGAAPVRPAAYKTLRRGHTNIVSAVAFRPHRPWELLSGGLDATVVRWDYSRLRPLHSWSLNSEATASGGGLGACAA
jgi:WD40 repeat protein